MRNESKPSLCNSNPVNRGFRLHPPLLVGMVGSPIKITLRKKERNECNDSLLQKEATNSGNQRRESPIMEPSMHLNFNLHRSNLS